MKYTKPEMDIKKFEIIENITEDLTSGTGNIPPWFVDDGANEGNLGGEILNNLYNNILNKLK